MSSPATSSPIALHDAPLDDSMDQGRYDTPPRTSVPPDTDLDQRESPHTLEYEDYEESEAMDMDVDTDGDDMDRGAIDAEPHVLEDAAEGEGRGNQVIEKGKRRETGKKGVVELEREPGKSLLPFSRVQKIIKADKEIAIVAKEATFLISLATEEFIRRVSEAGSKAASRDNRTMVQIRDIASVVRRVDEFMFLEDILPYIQDAEPKKKSNVEQKLKAATVKAKVKSAPTMLDQFMYKPPEEMDNAGGEAQRERSQSADSS